MNTLRQDRSEFNVLFVHSELDDFGLDTQEFRIYAHLARRANGKSKAYPGITSMSEACRMNRHTVLRAINGLEERGLIKVIKKSGAVNEYILTPPSEWKRSEATSAILGTGAQNDTSAQVGTGASPSTSMDVGTTPVPKMALPPVLKEALKGNPTEDNPFKDNTVGMQNGSLPEGKTALSRQNAADEVSQQARSPKLQSPVLRKAYAIADRLQYCHWDNCKVFYVKQTARSYAEKALGDGHEEQTLLHAYLTALRYCHRVITDEICRGERHQFEKASPALTVYLARQRLSGDPRTIEERWQVVIAKLSVEKCKAIEEEEKILTEIAESESEIKTWFSKNAEQTAVTA